MNNNLIDKIESNAKILGELSNDGWLTENYHPHSLSPEQVAKGDRYWELHKQQKTLLEELHNEVVEAAEKANAALIAKEKSNA